LIGMNIFYTINKVNNYLPVSALTTINYTLVYPPLDMWNRLIGAHITKRT